MKLNVKEVLKPAAILLLICAVVTFALAGANLLTKDQIEAQALAKAEESRKIVLPEADSFEPRNDGEYYVGLTAGQVTGYVFETEAKGYGGTVKVMTGISAEGAVTGVVILDHEETPGLGANAQKEEFRAQYKQSVTRRGISVVRYQTPGEGEIEAMTGATITSRAVTSAVNQAMNMYYTVAGGDQS